MSDTAAHSGAPTPAPAPSSGKPDRNDPAYRAAIEACMRWDFVRDEPYLQLPSFPDLRITPYRTGIAEQLRTLYTHPVVGERLFVTPYPMSEEYAANMESNNIAKAAPLLASLRMSFSTTLPAPEDAASTPLVPALGVDAILGCPFKTVRSVSEDRVVADLSLSPWTESQASLDRWTGSQAGDKDGPTEDDILARPPLDQQWMLGYVCEPAQSGRGMMTEALGCILQGYVRPFMHIGRVVAYINPDNIGSINVSTRNGLKFVREEMHRWADEKGGDIRPAGFYELDMRK